MELRSHVFLKPGEAEGAEGAEWQKVSGFGSLRFCDDL